MSSCDSEEFESAGEEVEETSSVKVNRKKLKTKKEKSEFSTPRKIESNSSDSSTSSKFAKTSNENSTKENEGKITSVSQENDMKNDWDVDDWGNDSPIEKPQENSLLPKIQQTVNEDNWSDFEDDWGKTDVESVSTVAGKEKANAMFPVLDGMSPSKEPKKSEGFFQNIANPVSNYQKFPVLNDLSTKKLTVGSGKPVEEHDNTTPAEVATTSNWGWKPWGGVMSSFITSAAEGVTSITSQVSQGFSTVIENSMGVPDPEELAKINKERMHQQEKNESKDKEPDADEKAIVSSLKDENILPTFGNIVTGVTSIGSKVLTGGLDTLEGIGKKTMTILQENDPLLLNKRKMLGLETNTPVLSQVLREAKEKSEEIEKNLKQMQKHSYKKQLHFESLFDNYYGLVHLEALEMLSKQSTIKLQSLLNPLTGKALVELQETLNEVKELCELGDAENDEMDGNYSAKELNDKLQTAVEDLGIPIDFNEIIKCWETNEAWLIENKEAAAQDIYEKGLRCLAETCALAICKMHKISEILLIKEHHSTANEADSLVRLTLVFCSHVNCIANRFGSKLNNFEKTEEVSSLITSIFLEVYNSTTYIQNAFQLLIPILQIGAA